MCLARPGSRNGGLEPPFLAAEKLLLAVDARHVRNPSFDCAIRALGNLFWNFAPQFPEEDVKAEI